MPNSKSNYHTYSHSDPGITTMGSFVSNGVSIGIGFDIVKLLNYEDEKGTKNIDNLVSLYTADELNNPSLLSLVNGIRSSSAKQQAESISTVSSSVANSSAPVSVTEVPQPKDFIKEKLGTAAQLKAAISDLSFYEKSKLPTPFDVKNQAYLNKLSILSVVSLFKKFIILVSNRTSYNVEITSSFRPLSKEESQYNDHFGGLALDINLVPQRGVQDKKPIRKPESLVYKDKAGNPSSTQFTPAERSAFFKVWRDTGVLDIAQELGIRWGGDFKTTYFDPIHFEATNYYTRDINGFNNALVENTVTLPNATSETEAPVSQNSVYADLPLHIGTVLNLPLIDIDREVLLTETNQAINTPDFESFLAKELLSLLRDKRYDRVFSQAKKPITISEVKEIFPFMSVWIWSRALSVFSDGEYVHKILNITPYISSLNTSVGENGGSFSIDLPAIEAEVLNNRWRVAQHTQQASTVSSGDYVSQSFLHYEEDNELKRSKFFFEKAFQQNDLVFIRFEQLIIEDKRQNLDDLDTIPISQLPNQIFDMIGLIDSPSISTQPASATVSISITGRDLVKLIIEDGVYFYPFDFINGGIFANENSSNHRLNRYNGRILTRFQTQNKTIEQALKFIMNALSSIEICPTSLFDSYANGIDRNTGQSPIDKRSKMYQLDDDVKNSIQDHQRSIDIKKSQVISQIDDIRQSNGITDSSSVLIYNLIENFLSARVVNNEIKVIESPFKIQSWSEIIGSNTIVDQVPSSLEDLLFNRKRLWVDNKSREVSTDVTQLVEDLFSEVSKEAIKQSRPEIFSNLLRDKGTTIIEGSDNLTYRLQDLITELQIIIDEVTISDGVSYSSEFAKTLINSFSTKHVTFRDDLATLTAKYKSVISTGNTISLVVLNRKRQDLSKAENNVFDSVYQIIKEEADVKKQQQTSPVLLPVNGIWQIIKLVIDDSVKNRLIADASIGNEHGSLINAIRKICQDPFCEFYTDTYADQFYFIIRKKPFDRESIVSMLEGRTMSEPVTPQVQLVTPTKPVTDLRPTPSPFTNTLASSGAVNQPTTNQQVSLIIEISESDVLSDSFTYSTEAYSWYRLQLKNLISGSDSDMAFAYLKAVYFNEFADVFGSKPLDVSTNYIPYQSIVDKSQALPTAYFIRQAIYDLKYLIESHAYLPFTRQGTIVMNPDRRIKRGTFVRLKSTGELFYVDSVAQSFSIDKSVIDRTTTLHVSRGMVEKYINGVTFDTGKEVVLISYFNICNLPIDESVFTKQQEGQSDFNRLVLSAWKVNPTTFNFFLRKLQFAKHTNEIIV